jgi:protein-tyrosine phosphatase
LKSHQGKSQQEAIEYIEKAPPQIMTRIRPKIEEALGLK